MRGPYEAIAQSVMLPQITSFLRVERQGTRAVFAVGGRKRRELLLG